MYGPMGMRGNLPQEKDKLTTLTRTDFLIQFVWQPPKPEDQPKTDEERKEKLAEIEKELAEAAKTSRRRRPTEAQLQKESLEKSEVVTKDLLKAQAQQPVPGAASPTPAPGTAPAAPGTAPAAPAPRRRPGAAPAAPGTPK